jgi:hypothetical protein
MKPFFIEIQNFWAWADKLGRKFWVIWGIFGQTYQDPFWYSECFPLFNHCFYKKPSLYIHIPNTFWDWDLNLGGKELGI